MCRAAGTGAAHSTEGDRPAKSAEDADNPSALPRDQPDTPCMLRPTTNGQPLLSTGEPFLATLRASFSHFAATPGRSGSHSREPGVCRDRSRHSLPHVDVAPTVQACTVSSRVSRLQRSRHCKRNGLPFTVYPSTALSCARRQLHFGICEHSSVCFSTASHYTVAAPDVRELWQRLRSVSL